MSPRERVLVRLSAALAARDRPRLDRAFDEAAASANATEIEEALLQSYLFLGYPAMLHALKLWRTRSELARPAELEADPGDWAARGEHVCARVYGGQYERLRANVARLHPELERWMVVEGYGKVLGRPGLDLRTRELCVIALLSSQDAPEQLYAHLRGALNVGASVADVEAALELAAEYAPPERAQAALRTWREVLARRQEGVAFPGDGG